MHAATANTSESHDRRITLDPRISRHKPAVSEFVSRADSAAAVFSNARPIRPAAHKRGWAFEPKWDGFRAIVRTGPDYMVSGRRGWPMAEFLPEFSSLPITGVFDCELVAFGNDGKPSFHRLCQRMLNRQQGIAVALVVFDVLALDEEPTIALP